MRVLEESNAPEQKCEAFRMVLVTASFRNENGRRRRSRGIGADGWLAGRETSAYANCLFSVSLSALRHIVETVRCVFAHKYAQRASAGLFNISETLVK